MKVEFGIPGIAAIPENVICHPGESLLVILRSMATSPPSSEKAPKPTTPETFVAPEGWQR